MAPPRLRVAHRAGGTKPCVQLKTTVMEAAATMDACGTSGVLVMLEGQRRLVGIFTTKDVLYRVVAAARNPGGPPFWRLSPARCLSGSQPINRRRP